MDPAGSTTDTYSYDAYGNLIAQTGSTPNRFLYRGEEFDSAITAYYLRSRWYLPLKGRFLSGDTYQGHRLAPKTQNRYSYGESDPVNKLDPSGNLAGVEYATASTLLEQVLADFVAGATIERFTALTDCLLVHLWSRVDQIAVALGGDPSLPPELFPNCQLPCQRDKPKLLPAWIAELQGYDFNREDDVFNIFRDGAAASGYGVRKHGEASARKGPCSIYSKYQPGTHTTVLWVGGPDSGDEIGSYGKCDCCDDRSGVAVQVKRCRLLSLFEDIGWE